MYRFHPPDPPSYRIDKDEESGKYVLSCEASETRPDLCRGLFVDVVTTSSKTKIPIICFRHPEATLTLIYSHGNATDLGGMFIMYAVMAFTLGITVVAYDYTGYGECEDGVRPTEKQTYKDIERVYDWCSETGLVQDPGASPPRPAIAIAITFD